jgi:hypothetical protein
MFKDAFKSASYLFFAFACISSAESPTSDEPHLPRQVQRIDGVLVPVASEIFSTLDQFHDANWRSVLRPDLATLQATGNAAQIALSLGVIIGEGFIAVAAQDKTEVQNLGRTAFKLARALGVEKSLLRRGASIIDHAGQKEWAAVRKEWSAADSDLKKAMIEIGSEPLSQLVSLGGWLRGADVLSALISRHYSAENAQLLYQPALLDYFGKRLSKMGSKIRDDAPILETENGIIRLRPLVETGSPNSISEPNVKEIHQIVADLIQTITTRAR